VNILTEKLSLISNNQFNRVERSYMLAIERMPYYKNKLLLSSMAVIAGFVMTVGIIRAVNPPDTSVSQSVVPNSDKRATSIFPVHASSSESSSESAKAGGTGGNANTSSDMNTSASVGKRTSTTSSSQQTNTSGAAPTQTSPQAQTSQSTSASSSNNQTTAEAKPTPSDQTQPSGSSSPVQTCLATILTIGLICH
jgi:hypothetical protein